MSVRARGWHMDHLEIILRSILAMWISRDCLICALGHGSAHLPSSMAHTWLRASEARESGSPGLAGFMRVKRVIVDSLYGCI